MLSIIIFTGPLHDTVQLHIASLTATCFHKVSTFKMCLYYYSRQSSLCTLHNRHTSCMAEVVSVSPPSVTIKMMFVRFTAPPEVFAISPLTLTYHDHMNIKLKKVRE